MCGLCIDNINKKFITYNQYFNDFIILMLYYESLGLHLALKVVLQSSILAY